MKEEINEVNKRKEEQYAQLEEFAMQLGFFEEPSLLHGALVGVIVVNPLNFEIVNELICELTQSDKIITKQLDYLRQLHTDNLAAMQDLDIEFLPIVAPEFNLPVVRINSIAAWCTGFLRGIDKAGVNLSQASEDLQLFLTTAVELSEQEFDDDDMPDTQKNAEDISMLEDFLKVGALYAYTDWVLEAKNAK